MFTLIAESGCTVQYKTLHPLTPGFIGIQPLCLLF